jgi:hypothetical protein
MEKEWELKINLQNKKWEQAHTFKLNKEKFMKEFPEVDAADVVYYDMSQNQTVNIIDDKASTKTKQRRYSF